MGMANIDLVLWKKINGEKTEIDLFLLEYQT